MRPGDLTTLANVKLWNNTDAYKSSGVGSDFVLSQLITRWSQSILAYLERPWILPRTYTNEAYDGNDNPSQYLRNWPVISISDVYINGQLIPPLPILQSAVPGMIPPNSSMYGFGYRFETDDGIPPGGPQAIKLIGTRFYRGKQNIQFTYTAGYQVTGEPWEIPDVMSPSTVSVVTTNQPYGIWASDASVVEAITGVVFTPTNGSPPSATNTYSVINPDPEPPGIYNFYPGDAGRNILISYGYIPSALEQVTIELVLERFRYRDRIGEVSRTLGGGQVTAKYDTSGFPTYVLDTLQRFRMILAI